MFIYIHVDGRTPANHLIWRISHFSKKTVSCTYNRSGGAVFLNHQQHVEPVLLKIAASQSIATVLDDPNQLKMAVSMGRCGTSSMTYGPWARDVFVCIWNKFCSNVRNWPKTTFTNTPVMHQACQASYQNYMIVSTKTMKVDLRWRKRVDTTAATETSPTLCFDVPWGFSTHRSL